MTETDFEQHLTDFLRAESARAIDADRAWHDLVNRKRASPNRNRWFAAACAALAVVLAATIPALVNRPGGLGEHPRPAAAGRIGSFSRAVVARIPVSASQVAAVEGGVWLLGTQPRPLIRFDTHTNKISTRLPLPARANADASIASGGGALWLVTSAGQAAGQILRLDPVTGHVVATLHLSMAGRCLGAEFFGGYLWVQCLASAARTVFVQVDPAGDKVTATAGPVPGTIYSATPTPNGLWYETDSAVNGLIRDGSHWRVATIKAADCQCTWPPDSLLYGMNALWGFTQDESIVKIDPVTGHIRRTFNYLAYSPAGRDYYFGFFAIGARSFWLPAPDGRVLRVDATTLRPLGWVPALGDCGMACSQIYFQQGSVWVLAARATFRIDPARMPPG